MKADRNLEIVELLRSGASSRVVADRFGLTAKTAGVLCARLRKKHGLPKGKAGRPNSGSGSVNDSTLIESILFGELGAEWLQQRLAKSEDRDLEIQLVNAARLLVTQEADDYILLVRRQLEKQQKARLLATVERTLGVSGASFPHFPRGPRREGERG